MVGYVVGRVYNASDNSLEDTFVVAAQTNLLDTPPSIEISNTGAFNISWIEYDLTGDQLGASEMVYGGEINELISGSASADYLYGQGGDDEIDGGAGDDLIDGGIGDDILTGGDGDDIIIAGDGEDLIIGGNGEGDDIYDGGSGSDTIKYTSARAGITVELESGLAFSSNADEDAEIGRDAISAVENIIAGDFSDYLSGSIDANIIQAGDGSDLILAGAGNDTIIVGGSQTFSSSYQAVNTSSTTQVGTGDKVTLEGMLRVEDVIDGGADTDTIELGKGNVAFFLHDAFSGFHSSVQLSSDSTGEHSRARLENIEKISGNDSDVNIIDLTSSDYSLARQSITIDGAGGRDIVWGSDANETIKGGDGDDVLFGGAGINVLTGGAGADEFQFTMTSKNDSVTNFNAAEGDTLKFFNTGGAEFDKSSAILSDGKLTIDYGSDANDLLTIDLGNTALTLSDVSDSLIFV
jgi:Ca2+-binding RTX toxin-like protein